MSGRKGKGRFSPRGGGTQRQSRDPPSVLEGEPQIEPQEPLLEDPPEAGMEFSPQPNPGAARGRRDEVTPAGVGFREEEGEGRLRRELNLREAQISALERELAKLKAQSRTSRASTLFEEDDPRPRPKYEKPRTFNGEYSPLYNLLNWLHSMKSYCAQHKCRDEDMVGLARTYMGPDVQAYLDAKYKGTLPEDWDELEKTLKLRYMLFDHKVRIELRFDALRQRSSLQAYMD